MKKRLVSIILTVFLVLSMMPFAAFADNAIVCPACGGEVIKKPYHLVGNYWDFYKCNTCGKWAYLSGVAGLKLLSAGDQAIINAADANAILNFSFNNGHLIPAEKAPSGIGRKDLPGYADDNGTPNYNHEGKLLLSVPCNGIFAGNFTTYYSTGSSRGWNVSGGVWHPDVLELDVNHDNNISGYGVAGEVNFYIKAPVTGIYYVYKSDFISSGSVLYVVSGNATEYKKENLRLDRIENRTKNTNQNIANVSNGCLSLFCNAGDEFWVMSGNSYYSSFAHFSGKSCKVVVDPTTNHIENSTSITINNNTWNGNIYVDNSNNLTYIYPQYTTINEKNETVTNISTNPIIYNNETKQYYTYDQTTKNYYYITYNAPSPSPTPAPTWTPGGGATRGGGVGRHPSDTDAADWTLHYYVLNNRRYDAYYALKKTEVDTDTKLPWVDNKKYISTTQIPIANGQYTVSVPDGVYWRVWSWDEASQTLTGVNSSNWHSTINNFLFNATGEYIFEFFKADGSDFDTAKDVTLKLKNDKITKYEDGGTIVEEPTPSPSPEPTETPSPTEPPTHTATPNPGGGTVPTPGGSGSGSGSGDNSWNPFKWLTDLLKDIVETILKGLWKLLTSIFGFILWLLSLLFKLFPWMPNSGILALCAGVVVVTVIRIIKFITGR